MLIVFFTFLCLRVVSQPNNCLSQNPTDLLQTGCISFTSQVQVQSTSYNNQIDVAVTAYPVPANDFSGIVCIDGYIQLSNHSRT